jgi:hypothetical protein
MMGKLCFTQAGAEENMRAAQLYPGGEMPAEGLRR